MAALDRTRLTGRLPSGAGFTVSVRVESLRATSAYRANRNRKPGTSWSEYSVVRDRRGFRRPGDARKYVAAMDGGVPQ